MEKASKILTISTLKNSSVKLKGLIFLQADISY